MTSFQITLTPSRRAAARFIMEVTRALQKAYGEEKRRRGLTQSDIAREIGVHRSIINRQLRGQRDMSLARVAEIASVMGRKPSFDLPDLTAGNGENVNQMAVPAADAPEKTQVIWNNLPERTVTKAAGDLVAS